MVMPSQLALTRKGSLFSPLTSCIVLYSLFMAEE